MDIHIICIEKFYHQPVIVDILSQQIELFSAGAIMIKAQFVCNLKTDLSSAEHLASLLPNRHPKSFAYLRYLKATQYFPCLEHIHTFIFLSQIYIDENYVGGPFNGLFLKTLNKNPLFSIFYLYLFEFGLVFHSYGWHSFWLYLTNGPESLVYCTSNIVQISYFMEFGDYEYRIGN